MKFSILSGAYINAGDFLIVDRTKKILEHIYPNCEIIEYKRNENLDEYIDEINSSDALIIAGGPAYISRMYPECISLVEDLSKIKVKIVPIGVGWYGLNTTEEFIDKYLFTNKTKSLLNRISKDSKILSCRDFYTMKSLKRNGYKNTIMTGCPAWYNLNFINELNIRENLNYDFKTICISDPATAENIPQAYEMAKYIKEKFPNAKVKFIFHRIDNKNNIYDKLQKKLLNIDIEIVNITGDCTGFNIYDDCDIHIGYRVHAHIYNLSNRNISILIEEDGRGAGVNEALGLLSLKAYIPNNNSVYKADLFSRGIRYAEKKLLSKGTYKCNKYLIESLDDYIELIKNNEYSQYKTAFYNMNMYYNIMENYIKKIIK